MADPATTKVTLVTLLGATFVGAAAELLVGWLAVLLGAGVGGLIACSMADELQGAPFWRRFLHWGLSGLVGAVSAPVALMVANRAYGPFDSGADLVMLPFLSMLAGGYWRHVARDIPAIWGKWRGKG